jgi:hypothetical protein
MTLFLLEHLKLLLKTTGLRCIGQPCEADTRDTVNPSGQYALLRCEYVWLRRLM